MSDDYSKKLAEHQRDVSAGRHGKPSAGNPYTLSYLYGAKLGGRDPNTGQLLNNATVNKVDQSQSSPTSSYSGIGTIFLLIAIVGFGLFQARDGMQKQAENRARVAPAATPTHYILNGEAQYFHADGKLRGKPASSKIVKPPAGKCFDLTRVKQTKGRATVDLRNYYGRVFRMYTAETTFAPLPSGARCEHQYYRP